MSCRVVYLGLGFYYVHRCERAYTVTSDSARAGPERTSPSRSARDGGTSRRRAPRRWLLCPEARASSEARIIAERACRPGEAAEADGEADGDAAGGGVAPAAGSSRARRGSLS
jgi:hypothetical protein